MKLTATFTLIDYSVTVIQTEKDGYNVYEYIGQTLQSHKQYEHLQHALEWYTELVLDK